MSGKTYLLRADSTFHDELTLAARSAALAEWSRSIPPVKGAKTSSSRRSTTSRDRRSVSLRTSSSDRGVKRRVRMRVRATPGQAAGTGQAVVSTLNLAYPIGAGWTEKVLPGAFADSITAHPQIPIYHQHDWLAGPIGVGTPMENGDQLIVDFRLYLGQGDLVDRVYQAMIDEALEEWSIGFFVDQITTDSKEPKCDQIAKGDLAEASVCVRGANPETGTLDLAARGRGWLMGTEAERRREVEVVKRATRRLTASSSR
jgi:HK97 family phage prohead protease